jgi:hypothetical protein
MVDTTYVTGWTVNNERGRQLRRLANVWSSTPIG